MKKKGLDKGGGRELNLSERLLLLLENFQRGFSIEDVLAMIAGFDREETVKWHRLKDNKLLLRRYFYQMVRRGYLKRSGKVFLLADKGKIKTVKAKIKTKEHNKAWDGKWRVVIFDIPENRRGIRDDLRINLKLLGFKNLQSSVWISPYDIDKELEELFNLYDVRNNVVSMLSDRIDGGERLEKMFFS